MNKVLVWYKNRICVPDVDGIKKLILGEAHDTLLTQFTRAVLVVWNEESGGEYVAVCDTCRRVKAEHRETCGFVATFEDPEWKWEEISMDFIVGLPGTRKGYNSISGGCSFHSGEHYLFGCKRELYISGIVCLHGVPKRIISIEVHSSHLVFGSELHDSLDSKLRFGTAYHPRTDGRTERTNRILEDMLRACAIQYGTGWDKSLPYAEFSYNNGYQAGLKKSPFEAPYGEGAGHRYFGTKRERSGCSGPTLSRMLNEQIKMVRENLRVARSRRKSYADVRRGDLTFKVDDFVYLKVSPMRGIRRFNMKGKPAPRYIGPFKIVERKGEVAYKLELPPNLSGIHNVFHVSQLKKWCRKNKHHREGLDVREDLTYTEHPVKILETSERVTRNRRVKMCECGGNITRKMRQLGKERRS
ncbi:LOW QUALITY PROTEIN: hypothetical protein U9M48_039808 [Paspalum notatum var. saurae]|uniref:Tf2-1-like SH3-like domain-containing protein n=1 Tax=Paspalum notatum var. saurae TaxID=547442 RepID=A0AAQ3UKA4_PASNO